MTGVFSFFTRKPEPPAAPSIREQMETVDDDLDRLGDRISRLGLAVRNDGYMVTTDCPPVASLSDAIEFVNTRVDHLHKIVDTIEAKLGF